MIADLCKHAEHRLRPAGRWHRMVSDPPPQELSRDGQTYYLDCFNAHRAIYSAEPPPAEPAIPR